MVLVGEREMVGIKYVISLGNRNDLMNVFLVCFVLFKKLIVGFMIC